MEEKMYINGSLEVKMRIGDDSVLLSWAGNTNDMNPARFIAPILNEALALSNNGEKRTILDFQKLEFINSSTIAQFISLLTRAKEGEYQVDIIYDGASRWQRMSFKMLDVFTTPDGRIRIRPAE